jgi:hypothetical protein
MTNEIKLKLTIDGKEANASLSLTDDNIKKIVNSVNRADQASKSHSRNLVSGLQDARNAIQGLKESYSILRSVFGGTIDAYGLQEKAEKKVEQAIISTGKAAGFTAEQLKKQATELQKLTLFGDEEILNRVTAQLLTFTNITQDNFLRTQKVALDLATVLDGDLQSASIMLGKALNDPVANLSALGRAGIQFSDDQKDVVKQLVATNQLYEAQSIILEELERQYGGQAEAMATTGTGAIKQFNNLIGDSTEKVGELITSGMLPFIKHLSEIVSNLNNASPALTGTIGVVGVLTTALVILRTTGVLPFIFSTNTMGIALGKARSSLLAGQRAGMLYAGGMRAAGRATKGFFVSLGPIGIAILGLTALAEIVNLFVSNTEESTAAMGSQEKELIKQRTEFNALIRIIKDANTQESIRAKAIKELNEKYPGYLGNLDLDKVKNEAIEIALKAANDEFERKIRLASLERVLQEKTNAAADKYAEIIEKQNKLFEYRKEHEEDEVVGKETVSIDARGRERTRDITAGDIIKDRQDEIKRLEADYDILIDKTNEFRDNFADSFAQDNVDDGQLKESIKNIDLLTKKLADLKKEYNLLNIDSKDYEANSIRIKNEIEQTAKELKKYQLTKKEIAGETDKELGLLGEIEKKIQELNKKRLFAKDVDELKSIEKHLIDLKKEKVTIETVIKGHPKIEIEDPKDIELPDLKIADESTKTNLQDEVDARTNAFAEEYRMLELWKNRELDLYADDQKAKTLIEQVYSKRREEIAVQESQHKVMMTQQLLGTMAGLFNEKTAAAKAIAIAQATWNTYQAATAALGAQPWGPWNIALAAMVTAAGLQQVSKIASTDTPQFTAYGVGGAIVGEKGIEIIAPAKDYASGFSELVTQTILTVEHNLKTAQLGNSNQLDNSELIKEFRETKSAIQKLSDGGLTAFISEKNFNKSVRNADSRRRKSRV